MAETVADVPELAAWWDTEKNTQPASAVPARNTRACWWKCDRGHSFQKAPRLVGRPPECPTCTLGTSTLADTHPALAKRWHPSKNAPSTPKDVSATHNGPAWWVCSEGHTFQRSPLQMVSDAACPHCALASASLGALFPEIAAEWHPHKNGDLKAEQVQPDHLMTAWWVCSKGHEFRATVRSRTRSHGRCPQCFGAWTVETIRSFVRSLLEHVHALNPSEMFALAMQAGALRGGASQAFVKALTTGRFPLTELEKFAEGKPSLVDEFAGNRDLTLEIVEAQQRADKAVQQANADKPEDPYALPAAPDADYLPDDGEIDVSLDVVPVDPLASGAELPEGAPLPVVQTRDALAALDSVFIANADAETVRFLLDSAEAKLWRHAYRSPEEAEQQARTFEGDAYSSIVRDRFLTKLDAAKSMKVPEGYAFRPSPSEPITLPHLMQRHVAVSVMEKRRFGNWSGMGAGKTLSAILATRLVGAELTVICCPNAVVTNWAKEIENAFPGCQIQTKTWTPEWSPMSPKPRYLLMNFEQFQQPDSEARLIDFLTAHVVDFVVVDEIHFAKQRDENAMSKRKRLVQAMILESGKKNADLCVLGMSGTPVINTLQEGKSLVEMITGHQHSDLDTKATVQNCMRLYQRLVTLGTRWKPDYTMQLTEKKLDVDCFDHLDEIRAVARGSVLEMERVLTQVRLPTIVDHLLTGKKTLIYTHYVDGIVPLIREAALEAGFKPGLCTGEVDDHDLEEFKKPNGDVDVLIASSRIATGVDGLQHVCNRLVINSLPWTNAEYEQLRARLWRQGSKFEKVEVIIPVTFAYVNGERWSYCESKLQRLEYKKSIADAAVDGVVPEGNLRTPSQAQQDILGWLERLETGAIETIERKLIEIPLSREPAKEKLRVQRYGDFSKMNNRWYASSSDKTHARLRANPEEWAHYHTLYQDLRKTWDVVPFQEEIRWLQKREGLTVGDFGCGEALIAKAVKDRHVVLSLDHVAIDDSVIACDLAALPHEVRDDSLDLAIFCLSLMGANFTDYLREAHRCLRLDGQIHIWEPASYLDDPSAFREGLKKLGFDVMEPTKAGAFLQFRGFKNANRPDPEVVLRFRGHA